MSWNISFSTAFLKFTNKAIRNNYSDFIGKLLSILFAKAINKKTLKAIAEALAYTYKKASSIDARRAIVTAVVNQGSSILHQDESLSAIHKMAYFFASYLFEISKAFKNVLDCQAKQTVDLFAQSICAVSDSGALVTCAGIALKMVVYKFSKQEYKYNREPRIKEEIYLQDLLAHLMTSVSGKSRPLAQALTEILCEVCLYQNALVLNDELLSCISAFIDDQVDTDLRRCLVPLICLLVLKKSFWNYKFLTAISQQSDKNELFVDILNELHFQSGIGAIALTSAKGKKNAKVGYIELEGIHGQIIESFMATSLELVGNSDFIAMLNSERDAGQDFGMLLKSASALNIVAQLFSQKYAGKRVKPKTQQTTNNALHLIRSAYQRLISNDRDDHNALVFVMILKFGLILDYESSGIELSEVLYEMITSLHSLKIDISDGQIGSNAISCRGKSLDLSNISILGYRTCGNPLLLWNYSIALLIDLFVSVSDLSSNTTSIYSMLTKTIKDNCNDLLLVATFLSIVNKLCAKNQNVDSLLAENRQNLIQNLANQNTSIVKLSLNLLVKLQYLNDVSTASRFIKSEKLCDYLLRVL